MPPVVEIIERCGGYVAVSGSTQTDVVQGFPKGGVIFIFKEKLHFRDIHRYTYIYKYGYYFKNLGY